MTTQDPCEQQEREYKEARKKVDAIKNENSGYLAIQPLNPSDPKEKTELTKNAQNSAARLQEAEEEAARKLKALEDCRLKHRR